MAKAKKKPAEDEPSAEEAEVQRLIAEITASEKYWKPYWRRCERILKRYEADAANANEEDSERSTFPILWANTETQKPLCYARVPEPVVTSRYQDSDKLATVAADVLGRAIKFSLESYDFDQVLKSCRDEFLLLAKAQAWARYVPTFEPLQPEAVEGVSADTKAGEEDDQELPNERVAYEEAVCDYVAYDDWGTNQCRNWAEVYLVWRKVYMGRPALKKRFTAKAPGSDQTIGDLVPLDWKPEGSTESQKETFGKAIIYEACDKNTGKFYWVSKSYPDCCLDVRDDPLGLTDFFPCAKPALGTTSPRKIIPVPDIAQYQGLANELDDLTLRIKILTRAIRMVGLYAGDKKVDLTAVFASAAENEMIPVDSWATWVEKGGIRGLVEWVPVEQAIKVVESLQTQREKVLASIYQITGIPDIMRGDTEADETAAAQGLKSKWGSSRMRDKQSEMARFCRDKMRITGEIIAKKFSIDTIKQMTNYQLLTRAEKKVLQDAIEAWKAAQQQAAQAAPPAQPGQPGAPPPQPQKPPIPDDKLALLEQPAWEDVDELLKSDAYRDFRIDIEADSTIEPDMQRDRVDAAEFAEAIGKLWTAALPIIQAAPAMAEPVKELSIYMAKRYRAGREIQDSFDRAVDRTAAGPPPPKEDKGKAGKSPQELAIMADGNNVKREAIAADRENAQADAATNAAHAENERLRIAADERMVRMEATLEAITRRLEAVLGAKAEMANAASAATANGGQSVQ